MARELSRTYVNNVSTCHDSCIYCPSQICLGADWQLWAIVVLEDGNKQTPTVRCNTFYSPIMLAKNYACYMCAMLRRYTSSSFCEERTVDLCKPCMTQTLV